jgi:hypothetical protein
MAVSRWAMPSVSALRAASKFPCAIMVPVKAPAKAVAFLQVNHHAAAFLRGFGNRDEIAKRNAVLLAEISRDLFVIFFRARDELEQIVALRGQFRRLVEAEFAGMAG